MSKSMSMSSASVATRTPADSTGRKSARAAAAPSSLTPSTSTEAGATTTSKKVAFISPPPTPGPDLTLADASPQQQPDGTGPLKTNVSLFHAKHTHPHAKDRERDPRGSTSSSNGASSSRTELGLGAASKASSSTARLPLSAPSPFPDKDKASVRSGTPYSQMTYSSSRILAASSWSEGAEEDLVSNLGPRERTRQEVLWEIVASEERYVIELQKLKDTFIDPLLHPYSASSPLTPLGSPGAQTEYDDYIGTPQSHHTQARVDSPRESIDHLPIASRFLSSPRPSTPGRREDINGNGHNNTNNNNSHRALDNIDGESLDSDEEDEGADRMGKAYTSTVGRVRGATSPPPGGGGGQMSKLNHPRSPYGTTATRTSTSTRGGRGAVPFPSRSHHSLPPPARAYDPRASSQSLGRQSFVDEPASPPPPPPGRKASASTTNTSTSRVLRKFKRSSASGPPEVVGVAPGQLPEDLRKCLEVIEGAIYNGHDILSKSLRKRYEEQYPLVRSLADVFVANSHILHGYATYVLHLERALEQIDDALSTAAASKKPKKQNADEWLRVCGLLQKLELAAADKGETGLAISLSKPFQRLLKYPLLFQNLLFHTDPSTFEYESTLQMVAEVETIVRSIEDEKVQKEERDKTRDVWARIEGLEKVKQLALPKPSRLLVEERQILGAGGPPPSSSPPVSNGKVKGKTSFKRLSDVLQGGGSNAVGGKKDLWLVVFNDVVLRCQRTGTTSLPITATVNSRTNSMPELQGKTKYATTGRRHLQAKPRNLYKFLKIETWSIGDVVQPQGVVAMEDVARHHRSQPQISAQPRIVPMPEDDEDEDGANDSDDSDRKSKMSFSYWGADKVTLQKPVPKPMRATGSSSRGGRGGSAAQTTAAYARESSANAKFGTRMVANDSPTTRPASRRTTATPGGARRPQPSDEGHSAKATVTTRPAWNTGGSRATATPIPKRARNISQTSASRATTTPKQLSSPAPSEDSGVGLYRQMIAKDSFLKESA
ncbi:Dbl domain-containing protein [Punctularia strigosozonata HHB-11173 SS5]|uniref:Dbl domain-containing protein n=1 Tax=Punctularia strigosozonata (strain HHB-11173) TaxID=741275 RepID=UPI00044175AA|nr:Dbl domain-containing protein [Punctularia strigosozonata HHB-11173 SS5]EIN07470.1 Dbl domain-containing protein [Punctularia strigosozonata HHB-11173 SS5]